MTAKRKVPQPPTATEPDGAVERFLASSDHPLKPVVAALRQLILGLDPRIREEIKWNAPSFFIDEHFATFRLGPPSADAVQVVLHTGARVRSAPTEFEIEDPTRLLKWPAKDRCLATFQSF